MINYQQAKNILKKAKVKIQDEEISIKNLANLIVNKFFKEKKLKVIYSKRNNFLRVNFNRTTVSTKKIRSLGWKILTSLEDGFKRTIKTYE